MVSLAEAYLIQMCAPCKDVSSQGHLSSLPHTSHQSYRSGMRHTSHESHMPHSQVYLFAAPSDWTNSADWAAVIATASAPSSSSVFWPEPHIGLGVSLGFKRHSIGVSTSFDLKPTCSATAAYAAAWVVLPSWIWQAVGVVRRNECGNCLGRNGSG